MLRLLTLTTMLVVPLGAAMILATSEYGTGKTAFSDWWQAQTRAARIHEGRISQVQSHEATDAIATELIEGRLSLREAAPAMYAEMERWILDTRAFQEFYSAESLEEAILCWAMSYAEARLVGDSQRREVLRRLRTELKRGNSARPSQSVKVRSLSLSKADVILDGREKSVPPPVLIDTDGFKVWDEMTPIKGGSNE